MASGVTVAYNGNVIHQMPSNGTFKMNTEGVYMEGDIDVVVDIPSGGGSTLVQKSITANGTYNPADDNADGYSQVVANVPNSYAQADEGKVVSNGALVAQTSATKTENGTYDTTLNNEIVVNVQGSSPTLVSKTITENGTYHAEDDDADGYDEVTVNVSGGITPSGSISITENGIYDVVDFASAIVSVPQGGGDDTIGIDVVIGNEVGSFYNSTISSIGTYAFYSCARLTEASFPNCEVIGANAFNTCSQLSQVSFPNCVTIGDYAFAYCYSLSQVNFPSCESIGGNAFLRCSKLTAVSFPNCETVGASAFTSCSSLLQANFPNCETIGSSAFYRCSSLAQISFPNCVTVNGYAFQNDVLLTQASFPNCVTIGVYAFNGCNKLSQLYLLGSSRVTLGGATALSNTPIVNSTYLGYFGSIYVPASLYDSYISAQYWSAYSARFVSLTDEEIAQL